MKNIHLIETEYKSKLYKCRFKGHLIFDPMTDLEGCFEEGFDPQFIYITNGEELTLNGYHFNSKYGDEPQKTNQRDIDSKKYWEEENYYIIKIVLTNDPTLIVDGVQELTEEQLKEIVSRYPLDYVEVSNDYLAWKKNDGDKPLNEFYSLSFSTENIINNWLDKNGTKEINKGAEMEAERYNKLISDFENMEGIISSMFDDKDWIKFERFVERQEKDNQEALNNKDNWEFERSSGYAGYRNKMTSDWIYKDKYLEKFAEKDKTEKLYTEEEVKILLLERDILNHSYKYGYIEDLTPIKEWFEKFKK